MAALGSPERADSLFGFLNVEPDADGRLRRTHLGFRSREGLWLRSMPAKAFQMLAARALPDSKLDRPLWIDYSIAWDKFARISWKDLLSVLEKKPAFFSDKLILVGGEYEGSQDFHRIPQRFGGGIDELSGLAIQALTINTLLEGGPIHEGSGLVILVLMAASLLAFSLMSFIWPKMSSSMILLISISAGYLLFSVILFRLGRQIWPIGLPVIIWLTALSAVLWIRRRLSFVSKEVD
jgi:CHASE2 domain-containing sensor protein